MSAATILRSYNSSRTSHVIDMVLRLDGNGEHVQLPSPVLGGVYVLLLASACSAVVRPLLGSCLLPPSRHVGVPLPSPPPPPQDDLHGLGVRKGPLPSGPDCV
jgi:hypothetical protein